MATWAGRTARSPGSIERKRASCDLLDPEAPAAVVRAAGIAKRIAQRGGMRRECVPASEEHAERVAEHQQCANEILLVPAPVFVERPLLRIIRREKDVVEMDAHASAQPRQHFEAQVIDV